MGISLNGLTPAGTYPGLIKTGDNTAISGTPKVLSDGLGNDLPMEVSTTGVNFTNNLTQGGTALQPVLVSGTNIKTINGASLLGSGNIPVVTSPSGVSGAIQFSDGSAFASDAANLFWDDTNNRLGVGTNAPSVRIHASQSFGASAISQLDRFGLFINYTSAIFGIAIGGSSTTGAGCVQGTNQTGNATGKLSLNPIGGNVSVGQVASGGGLAMLEVKGSGSTSATTSLLVQNSAGVASLQVLDDTSVFNNGKGGVASNTAFGNSALIANTTGGSNTANGYQALLNNTTGSFNTANGYRALFLNTTGSSNTAIGRQALFNNTASNNTAVGFESANANTTSTGITAIGYQALKLSTGANNTALGFQAGDNITTGAGNVCIGSGAEPLAATDSNQFVVGTATINAGSVTTESNLSLKVWNVIINGVAQKILLA
jgi:hypothetical protein